MVPIVTVGCVVLSILVFLREKKEKMMAFKYEPSSLYKYIMFKHCILARK